MPPSAAPSPVYDPRTILLHWLSAGWVVALWLLGQAIDWFPRGDPRVMARSAHIAFGALLALVVVYRILWRLRGGRRLPAAGTGPLDRLATGVHKALYLILSGTIALGLANAWVRGDNLFNLIRIPAFDPGDKALRGTVEACHSWCADLLLIVAGLHAAAALYHHLLRKDDVLRRMLPGPPRRPAR